MSSMQAKLVMSGSIVSLPSEGMFINSPFTNFGVGGSTLLLIASVSAVFAELYFFEPVPVFHFSVESLYHSRKPSNLKHESGRCLVLSQ